MNSRDIINSYIEEHGIQLEQYIDRQAMIDWCEAEYPHSGIKRVTLDERITIMITNNESRLHNHLREDGADDILYKDDIGLRLYDSKSDPTPIRDETADLPEIEAAGILVRWDPHDWNHDECLKSGTCDEEYTSIGALRHVKPGMKVVILCTRGHGVRAIGEVTGEITSETWKANHWRGEQKKEATTSNKRRVPISLTKAFIHPKMVEIDPLLKGHLRVQLSCYLSEDQLARYKAENKLN